MRLAAAVFSSQDCCGNRWIPRILYTSDSSSSSRQQPALPTTLPPPSQLDKLSLKHSLSRSKPQELVVFVRDINNTLSLFKPSSTTCAPSVAPDPLGIVALGHSLEVVYASNFLCSRPQNWRVVIGQSISQTPPLPNQPYISTSRIASRRRHLSRLGRFQLADT